MPEIDTKDLMSTVGPNNPMKLNIQNQNIIDNNIDILKLGQVTNPIPFEKGDIPTTTGLFSELIFGTTQDERRNKWGWIDLKTKVIHPYVFEVLCRVQLNIDKCCRGEGSWKIDGNHQLVPVKPEDPDYNEDNTGMDWFIENYPRIKFRRNGSRERDERLDFLATFAPGEIFIDKWFVMPVFYRDVENKSGSKMQIPPINDLYTDIIRYSNAIEMETIGFINNMAKYNLQKTLVAIRKHFQTLLEKSKGFFHQYVMGKNQDYGVRSVISCAVLDQYDKPDECPIDMIHSGIPLAEVCVAIFPFIVRWISNFMINNFEAATNTYAILDAKSKETNGDYGKVEDVMAMYTPEYIKKRINKWIDNYESRFDPVEVPTNDGRLMKVAFAGVPYSGKPDNVNAAVISKRVFTWTDLLYIAAEECINDKTIWIVRYPMASHMNTFPSKVHVLSTIETMPVMLNGKIYPWYPKIDPNAPKRVVSTSFNDTVTMSNMYLEAMTGDYDGDTVSARVPFTVEANEESEAIINSVRQYLNAQGKIVRNVKNESNLMLYNLTKYQ